MHIMETSKLPRAQIKHRYPVDLTAYASTQSTNWPLVGFTMTLRSHMLRGLEDKHLAFHKFTCVLLDEGLTRTLRNSVRNEWLIE